jgi:SAM-dependent methyltransferase
MKLAALPQSPIEWLALKANLMPIPLLQSQIAFVLSRAVLDAYQFDVFGACREGRKNLDEITKFTQLDKRALKSLLNVLIAAGYFNYTNGEYSLTKMAKKWALKDSPNSLYNQQLFNIVCWDWMTYLPEFLKTGKGLQYHETFNENEWDLYQKGMESVALGSAKPAVKMAPKLTNPTRMLDIGGSHGLYSIEFCEKYPTLKATVLDLPAAVEKAEPIMRKHYTGTNINYQGGDALTDDFGENQYDLVLMSSLMHHFSAEQNIAVSKKICKALKPGGYFIIQEFLRPEAANDMEMVGSILDLFFNLSSTSGNWSATELIDFQEKANLKHRKVNKFLAPPGYVQVVAQKG